MKKMNKKGFTLIEMLAVIAIIAVLVAIIVPAVGSSTIKATASTDAATLRSVLSAATIEYAETGSLDALNIDAPASKLDSDYDQIVVGLNGDAMEAYYTNGTNYISITALTAVADGTDSDGVVDTVLATSVTLTSSKTLG
jgi:type IV pilus assembly protein PilA